MSLPPVLMLHHVEPGPLDPPPLYPNSYLSRQDFAGFLDDLSTHGYRTLTLAAALQGKPPRRSVVLTFDDGCRCFRDHAWPELQARDMTATLFVVSRELGGTNRWDRPADTPGERAEELLGSGDLRRLAAAGVEIASHGRHHRDLTECSDEELREELQGSRADLEAMLDVKVRTFCYPYGHVDDRVRAAAEAAGYLAAVSIHAQPGSRPDDLWALPRMILNPGESRFERRLKVSGLYPLWSRLPRFGLLAGLRRRLAA
ncbi:MAG TPA: polysaccharide deacetylase family protein [Thermoanaerobaculia bacterium]|nr:polysaccharide deacetylase family protein [Thermoanaerobaculia bacterium]